MKRMDLTGLQVLETAHAQACSLGERLLGEQRCPAVSPQEIAERTLLEGRGAYLHQGVHGSTQ
jgi:hypothetical protein